MFLLNLIWRLCLLVVMTSADETWIQSINDSPTDAYEILKKEIGEDNLKKCLDESKIKWSSTNLTPLNLNSENGSKFKLCVLKIKWDISLPISRNRRDLSKRDTVKFDLEEMFHMQRNIDPSLKDYEDCLYRARTEMKPYPNTCYDIMKPSHTIEGVISEKHPEMYPWFEQVGRDLMYTFDYVLYDSVNQIRKENQLWFIISYIRMITLNIKNPFDIVDNIGTINRLSTKLSKEFDQHITVLEHKMNRLSNLFQAKFNITVLS